MSVYRFISLSLVVFCLSCEVVVADSNSKNCLTIHDFKRGLVVTSPANNRDIQQRYRLLKHPYVAKNDINSIFSNRINIQYAGLFAYKFWRNGKLIQYEKPMNDITGLLKFEIGTVHKVETMRINPSNPRREWEENYTIKIEKADDFVLSGCAYSAVKLIYSGTKTKNKIYIPELMLDVTPNRWGKYHTIRKRNIFDGRKWPFNKTATDALNYPITISTE